MIGGGAASQPACAGDAELSLAAPGHAVLRQGRALGSGTSRDSAMLRACSAHELPSGEPLTFLPAGAAAVGRQMDPGRKWVQLIGREGCGSSGECLSGFNNPPGSSPALHRIVSFLAALCLGHRPLQPPQPLFPPAASHPAAGWLGGQFCDVANDNPILWSVAGGVRSTVIVEPVTPGSYADLTGVPVTLQVDRRLIRDGARLRHCPTSPRCLQRRQPCSWRSAGRRHLCALWGAAAPAPACQHP